MERSRARCWTFPQWRSVTVDGLVKRHLVPRAPHSGPGGALSSSEAVARPRPEPTAGVPPEAANVALGNLFAELVGTWAAHRVLWALPRPHATIGAGERAG